MANNNDVTLTKDVSVIKKDRMRFTKNTLSSTLCYIAILFDAFYFVFVYSINPSEDVGKNFFFSIMIGFSVLCNLLFLLFTFLASEGVKNYSKLFSVLLIVIGVIQILRIFGIPLLGFLERLADGSRLISPLSFAVLALFLGISSVCCIVAGVVGIIKTTTLENYKKETGLN